jgi:hypothetical protein
MTPAELEKLARLRAGSVALDPAPPTTLLVPLLPPLHWDAAPRMQAGGGTCIYVIISNRQSSTISANTFFQFNQQSIYWTAFAVRPFGASDWDLTIHDAQAPDPDCVSATLARSDESIGVDFVVGDYNHNPLGFDYTSVYRFNGTENAIVQWDSGSDAVTIGETVHRTVAENDIVEAWDVFLESQETYRIYFDNEGTGNANLTVNLFQNPAAALYFAGRDAAVHTQDAGYGVFTAGASDWYGLTVTNENGGAGQYALAVKQCTDPLQLPYEDSRALTAPGEVFFVQPGVGVWAGVGVRGDNNSSWIAELREFGSSGPWPGCNGPLVAFDDGGTQTRLVLGDFHVNAPGEYYPIGLKKVGSAPGGGRIEWDDGRKFIVVNGGAVSKAPPGSDVFELWNVSLARGFPYTIEFAKAGADYKVLLFGNPSGAEFWPMRSQRILEITQNRTVFTPTFTGAYALVVVNDNGAVGDYSVAILSGAVGVADAGAPEPVTRLTGAAPNPTRGDVRIDFELGRADKVELAVVDVAGRIVARVAGRDFAPGSWSERWTGKDSNGRQVPAGTYWVRLAAGGREIGRQKVLVVR